jgi:hypothetical protein
MTREEEPTCCLEFVRNLTEHWNWLRREKKNLPDVWNWLGTYLNTEISLDKRRRTYMYLISGIA